MSHSKLTQMVLLTSLLLSGCVGSTPIPPTPTAELSFSPFGEILEGESDQPPLESVFAPLIASGEYSTQDQIQNEILKRAQEWVDKEVTYSIQINPVWGYRTDCSGFVSYAWGLQPGKYGGLNTNTLQSETQSIKLSSIDDLLPGDILNAHNDNTQHVVIFGGWKDESKHIFIAYEENGYYKKAISRQLQLEQRKDSQWYLPGEKDIVNGQILGEGPYYPYRLISVDVLGVSTSREMPPSEKWIALINQDNLWLIHPDGSGLTPVTTNGGQTWGAVAKWSPDGKTLAYTQNVSDNISVMLYDVQTSTNTTLITGVGSGFDWSLTGKQIIYDTPSKPSDPWNDKGLWVINVENRNTRQVIPPSKDNPSFMEPQWSSEGGYVLFLIPAWEPAGYGVSDFNTGKTIYLPLNPNGGSGAGNCEWAPSESTIACITVADESNKPELRLLNATGNIFQKIPLPEKMSGNSMLDWSPDGNKLAISYPDKSGIEWLLDVFSLNTKDVQPFARGFVSDWSPDGQWLLSWDGSKVPYVIYLTNVTSGDSLELTEGIYPIWQP